MRRPDEVDLDVTGVGGRPHLAAAVQPANAHVAGIGVGVDGNALGHLDAEVDAATRQHPAPAVEVDRQRAADELGLDVGAIEEVVAVGAHRRANVGRRHDS